MFIPRGRCRDYQPYWTPELDTLHKALDQAREKIESSPTNANVEAHSKAKAQYTRARTQATRKSWHEKTASLNMEKDMIGLWNLTRALNNDNPSKSKAVIEAITEKRAANVLQTFTRNKAPPMLPESESRRLERKQRTSFCHRTVKNETVPW